MENPFHHDGPDPALAVIAHALTSMAHSFAVIAANTTGITPAQKDAITKATLDLKSSHDRLVAAVQQADTVTVKK